MSRLLRLAALPRMVEDFAQIGKTIANLLHGSYSCETNCQRSDQLFLNLLQLFEGTVYCVSRTRARAVIDADFPLASNEFGKGGKKEEFVCCDFVLTSNITVSSSASVFTFTSHCEYNANIG